MIKGLFGISVILGGLLITNSVSATSWVNIGKAEGDTFYVDIDNETTNESVWKAPLKLIGAEETVFGEMRIDCSDYTAQIIASTYDDDWFDISSNSPEDFVAKKVCR